MAAKFYLIVLGLAAAVGVTLRSLMLFCTIDHTSGFIKTEYLPLAVIIIVLMIVAAALVFLIPLLSKTKANLNPKTATLVYIVCEVVMAISVLYEAFFSSILNYASSLQIVMHKAAAVGTAIALLYAAFCKFKNINYSKLINIVPVAFFISRIIIVFSEFATLATVSDTIIETAAMCLALVTFLNFAKQGCNIELKYPNLCRSVAVLSAYVCLVASLPRVFYFFTHPQGLAYFSNIPSFTILAAAIFSIGVALKFEE